MCFDNNNVLINRYLLKVFLR